MSLAVARTGGRRDVFALMSDETINRTDLCNRALVRIKQKNSGETSDGVLAEVNHELTEDLMSH